MDLEADQFANVTSQGRILQTGRGPSHFANQKPSLQTRPFRNLGVTYGIPVVVHSNLKKVNFCEAARFGIVRKKLLDSASSVNFIAWYSLLRHRRDP